MKNPLRKSTNAVLPALLLICQAAGARAQTWSPAHSSPSTATDILLFANGPAGEAKAQMPGSSGTPGVKTSLFADAGEGGGWDLTAGGAMAFYGPTLSVLASTQAETLIGSGELSYNFVNEGDFSSVAGTAVAAAWSAIAEVTGSGSWTSEGNDFQYFFELDFTSSILSFTTGAFPKFGLLVEDGAGNDLYYADNVGTLLELGATDTLEHQTYSGHVPVMDYDPATGPLKITWAGEHTATGSAFHEPVENLMTVRNTQMRMQTVPEVSTLMLGGMAAAPLIFRRRREKMAPSSGGCE